MKMLLYINSFFNKIFTKLSRILSNVKFLLKYLKNFPETLSRILVHGLPDALDRGEPPMVLGFLE